MNHPSAYGVIWKSFYMIFYEDDIYPEIQVPPAISAIRPEHLYQQQQQQKLSSPGDSHRWQVVVISIGNAVPLKIVPSDVHGPITLNNWIERMNKCHFKRDTRLCNMDNQDDSNDATWIWINPTILAIRWLSINRNNALKSTIILMWHLHCGNCVTSFWNLDLHVQLVER